MRIGIIGHLGAKKSFTDGQTVKTRTIFEGLNHFGYTNIICADTYFLKKNPIRFLGQLLNVLFITDKIIVLLSNRGRKILFPVLSRLGKCKDIYHYAIGGRLAVEVAESEKFKKQICSFKANWVESEKIAISLNEQGVANASFLPNFKCIKILDESEIPTIQGETYQFCMFGRVILEKGVEDAIRAVEKINESLNRPAVRLDIYGPIEDSYKERFEYVLQGVGEKYSRYCGIIPPSDSVSVLENYYMLLFPTYWKGEGMPGTIIDAFSSGLPVIARRWEYCDDMIDDMRTGLVYDFDQPEKLEEKILWAIGHQEIIYKMKKACLVKANEYSEKRVMEQIIAQIGQ